MPTLFSVEGPFTVPTYEGKAARTITPDNVATFWRTHTGFRRERGCYVFGIRGRGLTPGYIGKATKSFKQEVFAPQKLANYLRFLADVRKDTPVIFLIVAPRKRGRANEAHIGDLETFLIQAGVNANDELLNVKGTKKAEWGIAGVLRSSRGNPKKSAKDFKRLMKLAK